MLLLLPYLASAITDPKPSLVRDLDLCQDILLLVRDFDPYQDILLWGSVSASVLVFVGSFISPGVTLSGPGREVPASP